MVLFSPLSLLPNLRAWHLENQDSGEKLQGQFEPVGLTKTVTSNYAEHTSLNRANPILQFLNTSADTISFQARLFNQDTFDNQATDTLELLESWTRPEDKTGRPPLLTFHVGDGHVMLDVVIESLAGITFGRPTFFGGLRDISLTINLRAFEPFEIESQSFLASLGLALPSFSTRFHRSVTRDYYELITQREYDSPLLGDVIRKRHPTKAVIQTGDVITLPAIEGLRNEKVTQTSVALRTAYGRKDTPQRALRLEIFERRNEPFTSHIL